MKRIKFTESQIVKAIKEHESGKNVTTPARIASYYMIFLAVIGCNS